MEKLPLSSHQQNAVEALEELKKICDRHGITMILLAGTALGAVRERGMIRWDDDIDVGFTYGDWCKIRSVLLRELPGKFDYIDCDVDPEFPRFHGKILCERRNCVDLFLIAKWTKRPVASRIHWRIRKFTIESYKFSFGYTSPINPNTAKLWIVRKRAVRAVRKMNYLITKPLFLNRRKYVEIARRNERYFEDKPYDCYINLYSIYSMKKERLEKAWVEQTSMVEFEGKEYQTVGNPDAYLRHLYGDYMTPPPAEKRRAAHSEVF